MKFQISPSKLNVARCGRALDLLNNNVPPDTAENENTQFGTEMHDVLNAINSYDGIVDDNALDYIIMQYCSHEFELQRRYAIKYIENFPYKNIALSEFSCGLDENLKEAPFQTALFRGRIDAVIMEDENKAIIVDHKSAWNIYSPDTMQLRFYAWIFHRIFPYVDNIALSIYFLRYGQWVKTDFYLGKKAIANIEHAVLAAANEAWNVTLGEATPGKYCSVCPYLMSCPAAQKSIDVISSQQEAIELAKTLHVIKKQANEISRLLQAYSRENGFIPIDGDYGYGYSEKEYEYVEVQDVLPLIEKNKELIKALKVDMRVLKKFGLDLPKKKKYLARWGAHEKGKPIEEDE